MVQREQSDTPVKKQTRSCKLSKEQIDEKLYMIRRELIKHVGEHAILFVKDGRDMIPYFVKLEIQGRWIVALYKCYSPEGKFRCFLTYYVNSLSIMTGEQQIVYFDEI